MIGLATPGPPSVAPPTRVMPETAAEWGMRKMQMRNGSQAAEVDEFIVNIFLSKSAKFLIVIKQYCIVKKFSICCNVELFVIKPP